MFTLCLLFYLYIYISMSAWYFHLFLYIYMCIHIMHIRIHTVMPVMYEWSARTLLWLLYLTLKEQISCTYTDLTLTPHFTIKWHCVIYLTNNTEINVTVLNIHRIAWKLSSSTLSLNTDIFASILGFTYLAHIMTNFSIFLAYIQLFIWLLIPHCTLHGQTDTTKPQFKRSQNTNGTAWLCEDTICHNIASELIL